MKWLVTIALLGSSSIAAACPPENANPLAAAARTEEFRERARAADSIVYGVIERDISDRSERGGVLRVLHVYKGDATPDQRVRMRYAIPPYPCALAISPRTRHSVPRGSFGVALLTSDGSGLLPFTGFIGSGWTELLIREGLIQSAREGDEVGAE